MGRTKPAAEPERSDKSRFPALDDHTPEGNERPTRSAASDFATSDFETFMAANGFATAVFVAIVGFLAAAVAGRPDIGVPWMLRAGSTGVILTAAAIVVWRVTRRRLWRGFRDGFLAGAIASLVFLSKLAMLAASTEWS